MRSYEAARGLFSFLGFLSWVVIIVGIIVGLSSIVSVAEAARRWGGSPDGMKLLMIALPGLGIALVGVIGLAIVQNGRAAVDTAEYTQQMLQIARDQIEISRRSLKLQQGGPATSFGEALSKGGDDPGSDSPKAGASFAELTGAESAEAERSTLDEDSGQLPEPTAIVNDQNVALGLKDGVLDYSGRRILVENGRFLVGDRAFDMLASAQRHIEQAARAMDPMERTNPEAARDEALAPLPERSAEETKGETANLLALDNPLDPPPPFDEAGRTDAKGTRGKDLAGEAEPEPEAPEIETIAYKGTSITVEAGRFCVGNRGFKTLALAQAYVDSHS